MSDNSNKNNDGKGFSGLDSMVSDISEGTGKDTQTQSDTTESSPTQTTSQHSNVSPSPVRSESSGFPWIIGILIVIFAIWFVDNSSEKKQKKASYTQPYKENVSALEPGMIGDPDNQINKPFFIPKEKKEQPLVRLTDESSLCELQERLFMYGYYNAAIDGIYGPGMKKAILDYESTNNLKKTGIPSAHILEQLRQSGIENRKISTKNLNRNLSNTPRTGTTFVNTLANKVAPLQIVTSSNGTNFYVKVQNTYNKESYQTFFIRGGEKLNTKMPLGTFLIRYAAGKRWHGPRCMFGMNSLFSKADKDFVFYRDGNQIQGYKVELFLRRDGNLRTSKISREQF